MGLAKNSLLLEDIIWQFEPGQWLNLIEIFCWSKLKTQILIIHNQNVNSYYSEDFPENGSHPEPVWVNFLILYLCVNFVYDFPQAKTLAHASPYEVINVINITVKIMRDTTEKKGPLHTQSKLLVPRTLCVQSRILPLTAQMQIVKITIIIITRRPPPSCW